MPSPSHGARSSLLALAVLVGVIALTTMMTIAARRIPIQIPRKVMGRGRIREGQKTFIPIRLLTASVMPIIFAQTIIIVPGTLASFTQNPVLQDVASFFSPGELPYDLTFGVMILLFVPAFFLLLFGYALSWDIRDVRIAIDDRDRSQASRALASAFVESGYFAAVATIDGDAALHRLMDRNQIRAA